MVKMNNDAKKQALKDEFEFIFDTKKTFSMMNENGYPINSKPTPEQKQMFIEIICGNLYTENDLIHLSIKNDLYGEYHGWALTTDAFFVGGKFKLRSGDLKFDKVLYKDIEEVWTDFTIVTKDSVCINVEVLNRSQVYVGMGTYGIFPLDSRTTSKLGRFLNFAKNLT